MADAAPQQKELTLLIKLLKMTTSQTDGEALVAMRKANEQLVKYFNGDWEKLLTSRLTVIADPFGESPTAPPRRGAPPPQSAQPPRPTAPPPPQYTGAAQQRRGAQGYSYPPGPDPFANVGAQRTRPPQYPPHVHRVPPVSRKPANRWMDNNAMPARCQYCQEQLPAGRGIAVRYVSGGDMYFFCDQDCENDWFRTYAPKAAPTPPPQAQRQQRANTYSGNCQCCGNFIAAKAGFIVPKPQRGWDLFCSSACIAKGVSQPKATASSGGINDLQ